MACNPLRMFIFRIIYSGIGILIGICVAVVFGKVFHNGHAAVWGLSSAVLATLCMTQFVYLYIIKEKKRRPPSAIFLTIFGLLATLGVGAGMGGFAAYLGLGITDTLNGIPLYLPRSHYVVCVWAFMVLKWSLTIYIYSMFSFKYLKKVPKGFKRLEDGENEAIDEPIENGESTVKS